MAWSLEKLNRSSLYNALGIKLTHLELDRCIASLTPEPAVCWPDHQQPHGGVLFTLMDTTMATAVLSGFEPGEGNCATIDLSIQYLAPAREAPFVCDTRVERRGNKICFVRGEILDAQNDAVAMAQGTFRVMRK